MKKSSPKTKRKSAEHRLLPFQEKGRIEAGCDEAGRGCLAGPVFAAAVVLPPDLDERIAQGESELAALNDSKQLNESQREALRPIIEREALAWAVGVCDNREIDRANILRCSIEAMHRAIRKLSDTQSEFRGGQSVLPEKILVDGNRFYPYPEIPHETIVKGDGKMMAIAAASILAKTYRDDYMKKIAQEFPAYKWEINKGYPTADHRAAIAAIGPCKYHRMSFRLLPEQEPVQLELFPQ